MRQIVDGQRWWVTRVAMLPVHLLGFAIVVFFLVRLIPGDPVAEISGGQPMTPAQEAAARASLGLSGNLAMQFWHFVTNVVTLRLGNSVITGQPVLSTMLSKLPATVELAVIAMTGALLLTLASALLVALRPRNVVSRILTGYARAAGAVPDFVLGVAGILLFYSTLHWLPAPLGLYNPLLNAPPRITSFPVLDALLSGNTQLFGSMVAHLVLPELVLVLAYAPMIMKLFIRAVEDAADAPATRFRIASGAPRWAVFASVIRRAAPAAIAMSGTLFGFMLGGVVVIEQLFGMPGLGQYGVNAANTSDLVSLEGFLLVVAAMCLVVFLLVDIVNMVVDPRRRPGLPMGSS